MTRVDSCVGHQQHRFEAAQHAVGAPVLGQFDRGAQQVALVFFELAFEAVEQGEGVGGAAGEAAQHLALVQLAHLAGRALHDDVAQRYLAIAAERDLLAAPYAQDGGAVKLFHVCL